MMKKYTVSVGLALLLSSTAQAVSTPPRTMTFDGIAGRMEHDVAGDVVMNGAAVTYRGRVDGDLELNGASVDADAEVGGDAELNGASIEFAGSIAGQLEANGASVSLGGRFAGPVDANAGSANLDGEFGGLVTLQVGRARLAGRFAEIDARAEGGGGFFGRDRSRLVVAGELSAPSRLCAREVVFEPGAAIRAPVEIRSESRPELPDGADAALISWTQRTDNDCER